MIADEMVSLDDGTGVVHLAPAYGDLELGKTYGLPTLFSVDLSGEMFPEVKFATVPKATAPTPDSSSKKRINTSPKTSWPTASCTAQAASSTLILFAGAVTRRSSSTRKALGTCAPRWLKTSFWQIIRTSTGIPSTSREDALGGGSRTTSIGRCPESGIGAHRCPFGSLRMGKNSTALEASKELSELTGQDFSDLELHRPYVDDITFQKNGKTFKRLPYTVDVWFESGAMPYAQWHYPFENEDKLAPNFPADYICEAIDQTRGWFYSLHAIATLLTDSGDGKRQPGVLANIEQDTSAFKNCIVLRSHHRRKGQQDVQIQR